MLEWIIHVDTLLFHFINGTLANPITDLIMPMVTNDMFLRVLFGLTIIFLLVFGKKRFIWIVIFSALVVALCDQGSSAFLKPLIGRLRPCKTMNVHLLVHCGAGLSFPSSHAANIFGQAVFFGLLFKKYRWLFIAFAFLVGISRVFVGVHYPLDVAGGAILGGIIGWGMAEAMIRLKRKNKLKPVPYIDMDMKQ